MKIQLTAVELNYLLDIYNKRLLNSERERDLNKAKTDLINIGFIKDDKLTPHGKAYLEGLLAND